MLNAALPEEQAVGGSIPSPGAIVLSIRRTVISTQC